MIYPSEKEINSNYAILIPTSTYHNITNIGYKPLKLYTIYDPTNYQKGIINITKTETQLPVEFFSTLSLLKKYKLSSKLKW